jgi:urate oxidase
MAIVLGENRWGKAEVRLVRLTKDPSDPAVRHVQDLNVTTQLYGDTTAVHLHGDNAVVLTTDAQKNTVFAFAQEAPVGEPEQFGLRLARHFLDSQEPVYRAQVRLQQLPWTRMAFDGEPTPYSFVRSSDEKRLASVTMEGDHAWVTAGLTDLVVLNATGSEFHGYPKDRYTTLPETKDRILATAVTARWRYAETDPAALAAIDFGTDFASVRGLLLQAFAQHSLSLQNLLYRMGEAALEAHPRLAEIRLSMPNKHHFLVDLTPFGQENDNEVFFAADRPYGLIEGAVTRDDAPPQGLAWLGF